MNTISTHKSLYGRGALLITALLFSTTPQAAEINSAWSPWFADQNLITVDKARAANDNSELAALKDRVKGLKEPELNNIRHWQSHNANYRWMQMALRNYAKGPPSPKKSRGIALLNVAIYDAVAIAYQAKDKYQKARPIGIDTHIATPTSYSYPSAHAAAAGAAAKILTYLFPDSAAEFQSQAAASGASRVDAGVNFPSDVEAGLFIGDQVAQQLIAYAGTDNSDSKWTGERPTGPDKLQGDVFVYPTVGDWKPWTIKAVSDYLPSPPAAVGSEELDLQLAELNAIDRSVPNAIRAWTNHSTERAYQWWYEKIANAAFELGQSGTTPQTALAYATVSVANHDAIIACFHAKYTYWFIRPAQLDKKLPALFPNPPHPSYPAAHSCSSMSNAVTIGHFFPQQEQAMLAAAEEAGYSRQIGGIHYPMDQEAGEMIGSKVAADVLQYAATLVQ